MDPRRAGVPDEVWAEATASAHELRVRDVIQETPDVRSFALEVPEALKQAFAYRPGQYLSFKIPYEGKVLTRSYSLASSPHCDDEHRFTVKRVNHGRISNFLNDEINPGDTLMVVPPAGLFVLGEGEGEVVLFAGGSGITPCISIAKSALATTGRAVRLLYANRNRRSIIFRDEIEALARRDPERFELVHSLDDEEGLADVARIKRFAGEDSHSDFYLCGPGAFMATVEEALRELRVAHERIHVEVFVSPPDPDDHAERGAPSAATASGSEEIPERITVVLDGETHEVPYEKGEAVLHAARRAGLDPPFSCEEGYCACCMARLVEGEVRMKTNDCLTPELLQEGWVLTCQSRCISPRIRVDYPD